MKTRKKLTRLAAVGIFAAVILLAATPAYAWSSVGFSGTFVGPHAAVSVSTYPYWHHRYYYRYPYWHYRYYPYRSYVRYYPYRTYVYPRVYYRHYYYRPYVRYYPRPVYYGPYYYPY